MVGYDGDRQTVYGKDEDGHSRYADAMTYREARRKLDELHSAGIPKAIYLLHPVVVVPAASVTVAKRARAGRQNSGFGRKG